jgi:hypothetical protein
VWTERSRASLQHRDSFGVLVRVFGFRFSVAKPLHDQLSEIGIGAAARSGNHQCRASHPFETPIEVIERTLYSI